MKKLLLVFLAAALAAPFLLYSAEVIPAKDVTIKKAGGNTKAAVKYSHAQHDKKIGAKAKECKACHDAVKTKDSAHKYCAECHKTMKAGPTLAKCNDCHKPVK
jgi:hypothetical protein